MRASLAFGLGLAGLAGCNQIFGLEPPVHTDADPDLDAPPSTGWTTPVRLPGSDASASEDHPALTPDGLELYFSRSSAAPRDIYSARRNSITEPFPMATPVTDLNLTSDDRGPLFESDGTMLTAYFASTRSGAGDIYSAARLNGAFTWSTPVPLANLDSFAVESGAAPCQGGAHFVVASTRDSPDSELYDDAFGVLMKIPATSSPSQEQSPFLTEDCKTLYFASDVAGKFDLYVTVRDADGNFGAPQKLDVSGDADEVDPWVSPDGSHLLFASDAAGTYDLYESFRNP